MAVALSDSMDYVEVEDGEKTVKKPSLLTKLFAAFVEESTGPGVEVHKIKQPSEEPSCSRFHVAFDADTITRAGSTMASSIWGSDQIVHVVLLVTIPMGHEIDWF